MTAAGRIREDALYRSIVPPDLLRALVNLRNGAPGAIADLIEDAIKEYLSRRGVGLEESRRNRENGPSKRKRQNRRMI